jgi:hypothetical protein
VRPTYGLTPIAIALGVIVVAFVIGVLRRRARLRKAQRLAPDTFVFRFSMWGDFGTVLPHLPPSSLRSRRAGVDRVASVSATREGLAIWQEAAGIQLADIPWSAITRVDASSTRAKVALSSIEYPTIFVETTNSKGSPVRLPFLSANSRFFWPRTSTWEVERIVEKLNALLAAFERPIDR